MNPDIQQFIQDEVARQVTQMNDNFNVPFHIHNGIDAPQIDPNTLLGFPIRSVTPTETPIQGKMVLSDISGTRKIWAFINGTWYSATLS